MGLLRLMLSANQTVGFLKVYYLMKEVCYETDFLYADKHERFAQVQLCFTCLILSLQKLYLLILANPAKYSGWNLQTQPLS